jgi:hypothetical protein
MGNIMICNVFETEAQAIEAQEYDFKKFMDVYSDDNGYDNSTQYWDIPRQRNTDGKWFYIVCPQSDKEYVTEKYSEDWIESEDVSQ